MTYCDLQGDIFEIGRAYCELVSGSTRFYFTKQHFWFPLLLSSCLCFKGEVVFGHTFMYFKLEVWSEGEEGVYEKRVIRKKREKERKGKNKRENQNAA